MPARVNRQTRASLKFTNHHQEIHLLQRMLAAVITGLVVTSCAQSPSMGETEIRQGRITRIDPVSLEGDHQLGLGAIIGGIAGGVLGHQIGGGTGQTVATIAGVLAGGAVGQGRPEPLRGTAAGATHHGRLGQWLRDRYHAARGPGSARRRPGSDRRLGDRCAGVTSLAAHRDRTMTIISLYFEILQSRAGLKKTTAAHWA